VVMLPVSAAAIKTSSARNRSIFFRSGIVSRRPVIRPCLPDAQNL
jgi:hypothetical protein